MRRIAGSLTAATVTAGLLSLAPTAQGADRPVPVGSQNADVHRQNGTPLTAKSTAAPGQVVKDYLLANGVSKAAVGSLTSSGAVWKTRGISHLRMDQQVGGLRVEGSYAKAAFNKDGQLLDLIDAIAPVNGSPTKAGISAADALGVAVKSLYPGRAASTKVSSRSGNTTTFARGGFVAEPTVEKVAVPTTGGGLAEGYLVTTWNGEDNALYQTLVSGDGAVVSQELRTAEDGYKVFPKDPDSTPQTMANNPADPTASPWGWLLGDQQLTTNISGNNAHAYLDANDDNAPDAGGSSVSNGMFDATEDFTKQPSEDPNRAVAVQNLFYLNNLIHDTLFKAGFTDAAGNFQEKNTSPVGNAGDPVQAEAQDGGGTDNANFATPVDGKAPRMQMYLWSVPGMYEVRIPVGQPGAGRYDAANAEWGAPLTKTGVSGPLALADDATGTTTDACEPLTASMTGKVVIADRGTCNFTVKAKNAQNAGAVGIIIANNRPDAPVPMGGSDPSVTITGVMVSQTDGTTLKGVLGSTAVLKLTEPAPKMKDGDLDSDIVWHEYGHGLTWRMITHMDGPLAGAIGEGMSDVLAEIVNDDPVIGEYAASDPNGIRTHNYAGYNRTYGDITGSEVHLDGEVYGAIGWELWKEYQGAHLGQDAILADLVDGMNYTQPWPAYEDMRDGILAGLANSGHSERSCMVWDAFAKYGVGVGARGKVLGGPVSGPYASGKSVSVSESSAVPVVCS